MNHSGDGEQDTAADSRHAPADRTQQQRGFKRDVTRVEAFGDETNPHTDRDRHRKPQHQVDFLTCGPLFSEEQVFELYRPDNRARDCGGYAQLHQQQYPYEWLFGHDNCWAACSSKDAAFCPAGTPPCANSLLPPPRPPTEASVFLRRAPISRFIPGDVANTTDAGGTSLPSNTTTLSPNFVTFWASNLTKTMSLSEKLFLTNLRPLFSGTSEINFDAIASATSPSRASLSLLVLFASSCDFFTC